MVSKNQNPSFLDSVIFVADILGIIFGLTYIAFSLILMVLGLANIPLSIILISITSVYLVISLVFLIFFGRERKLKKIIKLIVRYTKYAIRLSNMIITLIIIINVPPGNMLWTVLGFVMLITSFSLSLILDIIIWWLKITLKRIKANFAHTAESIMTLASGAFDCVKRLSTKSETACTIENDNILLIEESMLKE